MYSQLGHSCIYLRPSCNSAPPASPGVPDGELEDTVGEDLVARGVGGLQSHQRPGRVQQAELSQGPHAPDELGHVLLLEQGVLEHAQVEDPEVTVALSPGATEMVQPGLVEPLGSVRLESLDLHLTEVVQHDVGGDGEVEVLQVRTGGLHRVVNSGSEIHIERL